MSVEESWQRICEWYGHHVPADEFRPASRATEEQIVALEEVLGIRLPDDMRQSYRVHNGTDRTYLVQWGDLISLEEIAAQWQTFSEWQRDDGWGEGEEYTTEDIGWGYGASYEARVPDAEQPRVTGEPIKPIWWNPLRIPVTDISGADPIFVDLDPAEGGVRGQIISYSHEVGPLRVLASSWSEWLEGIADALDAGKLVYEGDGGVYPPGYYT
jgi:cell wall assembly regulator SMI1